jgi:hypothetical protein
MNRTSGVRPLRSYGSLATLFLALGLLSALIFAARATSETPPECPAGTHKTLEVGIVTAIGCWIETTENGSTVYTGRWEDQASARFAQTPDTFRTALLAPKSSAGREALRAGGLRVRVRAERAGQRAAAAGVVRRSGG